MWFLTWTYHETVTTDSNALPGGLYRSGILALWLVDSAKWALAGDDRRGHLFLILFLLQCQGLAIVLLCDYR